jgi:hypothetical protein
VSRTILKNLNQSRIFTTEVDKGISGGADQPAPHVCVGNVYFESLEGFEKGMAEAG